jgi:hypothetical protein
LVAAIVAMLAIAACGEEEGAADGVRSAVPADAVLYAEAAIRPEGELGEQVDALLERFGAPDPGTLITEAIDSAAAEDGGDFTYADDIEPWLGERSATFFLDFNETGISPNDIMLEEPPSGDVAESEPQNLAVLIESTDDDAASAFVDKALEQEGGGTDESFDGHDYTLVEGGTAIAVAEGLVIFGSEAAVQAAFETLDGGDAFAGDGLNEEALASLYVDVEAAIASAGGLDEEDQAAVDALSLRSVLEQPVTGELLLGDDTVSADFSYGSLGTLGGIYFADGTSPLLGELPDDAWFAAAVPDVGAAYAEILDQVGELPEAEGGFDIFEQQLQQFAGVSVDQALGAFGDVAYFVRGSDLASFDGAAVVEITDEETATKLLDAGARQIAREPEVSQVRPVEIGGAEGFSVAVPDLPRPALFVLDGDRLVIGFGEQATQDAVDAASPLSGSETFQRAEEALGSETPTALFVDLAGAIPAIATLAVGTDDLGVAGAYLEPLAFVASGSSDDGDVGRSRIVVGYD